LRVVFISVAIVIFLLFLGSQAYQILYPHWYIEWNGVGGSEITCFREYSEVMRFADDLKKRGMTTWRARRMRDCPSP
jgi:hypothetical protein